MKYFTVVSKSDENSQRIRQEITEYLVKHGFYGDELHPELVIVVGGDGKLLRTVHRYLDHLHKVSFLAISTGRLGFHADYMQEEVSELLEAIVSGEAKIEETPLLEIDLQCNGGNDTFYAMNEFRLEHKTHTSVIDVQVNREYLERFYGNGLCVSTQFGSSAYNRSLGGAIIFPGVPVFQLTEIAAISNNAYTSLASPLILAKGMELILTSPDFNDSIMGIDFLVLKHENVESVTCRLSGKMVRFARYRPASYVKRLHRSFIRNNNINNR